MIEIIVALILIGIPAGWNFYIHFIRAERDVPMLMKILWSADDLQVRCVWPSRRGEGALFLDAPQPWPDDIKERLIRASRAAARAGLVKRGYTRGLIGGDTFVGINPAYLGLPEAS